MTKEKRIELIKDVTKKLQAQGKRATRGASERFQYQCVYRAEDGRKCAFGHLIPDEMYESEMEGKSACAVLRDFPTVKKHLETIYDALAPDDLDFIDSIQYLLHDH